MEVANSKAGATVPGYHPLNKKTHLRLLLLLLLL